MSTGSTPYDRPARAQSEWASLPLSREFWGGVTLVAVWLAVLFVGVFGGNVQTSSATGDSSSWPVVVVVAVAALLATVSVGRWAFGHRRADEDLRRAVEEEHRSLEQLNAQLEDLRTKVPPT